MCCAAVSLFLSHLFALSNQTDNFFLHLSLSCDVCKTSNVHYRHIYILHGAYNLTVIFSNDLMLMCFHLNVDIPQCQFELFCFPSLRIGVFVLSLDKKCPFRFDIQIYLNTNETCTKHRTINNWIRIFNKGIKIGKKQHWCPAGIRLFCERNDCSVHWIFFYKKFPFHLYGGKSKELLISLA